MEPTALDRVSHFNAVDSELVCEEADDAFVFLFCPICDNVFEPPIYQCPLGHCVCKKCWDGWIRASALSSSRAPPSCPTCRTVVSSSTLVRNLHFEFVIEELKKNSFTERNLTASCALLSLLKRQHDQQATGQDADLEAAIGTTVEHHDSPQADPFAQDAPVPANIITVQPNSALIALSKQDTLRIAALVMLLVLLGLRLPVLAPGVATHFFPNTLSASQLLEQAEEQEAKQQQETAYASTASRQAQAMLFTQEHALSRSAGSSSRRMSSGPTRLRAHTTDAYIAPRAIVSPAQHALQVLTIQTGGEAHVSRGKYLHTPSAATATTEELRPEILQQQQFTRQTTALYVSPLITTYDEAEAAAVMADVQRRKGFERLMDEYEMQRLINIFQNEERKVHLPPNLLVEEICHVVSEWAQVVVSQLWVGVTCCIDSLLWVLSYAVYYVLFSLYRLLLVCVLLFKVAVYLLYLLVQSAYQSRDIWGQALLACVGFVLNVAAEGLQYVVILVNNLVDCLYV
eukprot:TRINITY_DN2346_c0_g1_i1.p1 TRINITY_DN2346_c0_g1~~TRINITY_DN2346_c0_g1_i1.p1  ORF type:complete len:515 (-),score=78.65 TRINITY_DN2346_c0_g1_i1:144-1688(-)